MVEAALLAAATVCALIGMTWIALAMQPHWVQARGGARLSSPASRKLRISGGAALFASLLFCLAANHVSMASLVWVMTLSFAALSVALALAYRPKWLRWLVLWVRAS